jgi:hypothetical protein
LHRSVYKGFIAAIACAASMPYMATSLAQDVQALCAHLVNDDRLRPLPAALVPEARGLFGFSTDTPNAFIKKSTSFRCMKGKVWLCNYGANLVCGKANASRTSAGAADFCRQNPGADIVPMAATGHDTIYEWKCVGDEARISKQVETVDPRGFIAENWKELE